MTIPVKYGCVVAVAFTVCILPICLLETHEQFGQHFPLLSLVAQMLTLPALPFVYLLLQVYFPADSPTISAGQYFYIVFRVLFSALFWGAVASIICLIYRHVFSKRDVA